MNQSKTTNPRIGLPFCCLIIQMIFTSGVLVTKYFVALLVVWTILDGPQFQDPLLSIQETKKINDVRARNRTTVDIFSDNDMENITVPEPSSQDIFEEKVRIIMDALSTQMGPHTLYEGQNRKVIDINEHKKALFSMKSDMHA